MNWQNMKEHYVRKDGTIGNRTKDRYNNKWRRLWYRISNPYLRRFYYRGIARFIRKFPKRNRIFKNRGSFRRDKEITEALAVVNAMKRFNIKPEVVFDIGSGVGFFTQINSVVNPNSFTYAIDVNKEMRTTQFDAIPNAEFHLMDIYSDGFDQWIKGTMHDITLVGVHLCHDLSPKLIELYNKHPTVKNMILLPCCHNRSKNYGKWMSYLYDQIDHGRTSKYIDNRILSVRDGVIVAQKPESVLYPTSYREKLE